MAKKLSRRTVILSISAITTVYLAGYVITEPAAQQIARAEASGGATPVASAIAQTPTSRAAVPTTDSPRNNVAPSSFARTTIAPASPTAQPTALPTQVV